jgi:hypothetical protein
VVASTAFQTSIIATEDIIEEGKGVNISIHSRPDNPNLTYPEELEVDCEAWDVHEYERLLQEQDKLQQYELDHKEYLHRRAMRDKQQLQEDQGLDWPAGTRIVNKQLMFDANRNYSEKIKALTLMGVTYATLASKHQLVSDVMTDEYCDVANEYIVTKLSRLDFDHTYPKDKIGVFDQGYVIQTFLIEKVYDWVEDYVLRLYGTGAIMAGPAYDK